MKILFITGNNDKFREFKSLVKFPITRKKINLPELQGTPEEIAMEKVKIAAKITKQTCIVEDTCLCFDAWEGLPGPYIKDFVQKMGIKQLSKTLLDSTTNRKAKAITTIGFCEKGKKPVCIQGMTEGTISLPKGNKNFTKGWDQIFIPKGSKKTYAQMDLEEKNKYSHRKKAIRNFEEFLKKTI